MKKNNGLIAKVVVIFLIVALVITYTVPFVTMFFQNLIQVEQTVASALDVDEESPGSAGQDAR